MLTLNNSSNLTVVWINTGHDWWCCLIHGNKLIAISEERLTRKKHCNWYLYSLEYVLNSLNIKITDVDLFVYSSYHKNLPKWYMWDLKSFWIDKSKFINIDHHLSHAYSWFYLSGFEESIILTIDWLWNNTDTESYYIWKWNKIKKIWWNSSTRSIFKWIGRTYESFTNFIWWPAADAWKTMWLSSYWKFYWKDLNLFNINEKLEIESNLDWKYEFAVNSFLDKSDNKNLLDLKWKKEEAWDIASFVQYKLEEIIIKLVDWLVKKTWIRKICLVWWVALNWLVNYKLIEKWIVDEIFIPPFPCDTWECVWNAIWWLAKKWIYIKQKIINPSLWKKYTNKELFEIINKKQSKYILPYEVKKTDFIVDTIDSEDILLEKVAKYINEWKIVWWFQWWSELWPRALWYRSILANPKLSWIKDYINSRVKHRESFRPFACSIIQEDIGNFFNLKKDSPFMMEICTVKDEYINKLPWITHIDNTCRIQTINSNNNPLYYRLLKKIQEFTWYPMVLNTSFNDNNEPIVENPVDALKNLAVWNIDLLVVNNNIITL